MRDKQSPDSPAPFWLSMLGVKDTEPPISDEEYDSYSRFRDGASFIPADIGATFPPCPAQADRKSRAAIRLLLADPRIPAVLELIDKARVDKAEEEKIIDEKRNAARALKKVETLRNKLKEIDAFHDNALNNLRYDVGSLMNIIGRESVEQATLKITQESYSDSTKNKRALNLNLAQQGGGTSGAIFGALASAENAMRDKSNARKTADEIALVSIGRSLVNMKNEERATLRMADVLVALGFMTDDERLQIAAPIVWNNGECDIDFSQTSSEFRLRAAMLETLKPLMTAGLSTSAGARERLNQSVRSALNPSGALPASQREIVERYLFSGNRWMAPSESTAQSSPSALRLGGFEGTQQEFFYDLNESLVTVAPPGSGKSQALVMRNLLYLNAPAVVLDVKGEMLNATRQWRSTIGKTYVFTPQSVNDSIRYNPLDDIREDPELAWEDARRLADLLVIPSSSSSSGDYFESRARDMITTALLDVALSATAPSRTMAGVLDRLYQSADEDVLEWCDHLKSTGNVQLMRQAEALRGMPAKQREGIFDGARRQLEVWQSPAIAKISSETNFDASALRRENATLYLSVALEDIKKYASVLRVLIGQTLAKLYREKAEGVAVPVTFFLDELPRLGRMDVIEESLDVGRGYGVRIWMFCQNYGQLEAAYPNAQGIMSNCAVRCYMNPDEDSARWIAQNLGTRDGLLDGSRKPLVEPHQLTGTEFADRLIVFSRASPPARLLKKPAYSDPLCVQRVHGTDPSPPPGESEAAAPSETPVIVPEQTSPEQQPVPSWESLTATPSVQPALPSTTPLQVSNPSAPRFALVPVLVAAVLLVAALAWIVMQANELRALREENTAALQSRDLSANSSRNITQERDRLSNALRAAEQERYTSRSEAQTVRADLARERTAHASTQQSLASVQRQLDTERSARASSSVPAPSPPPPQATPGSPFPNASLSTVTLPATANDKGGSTANVMDCDTLAANPNDAKRTGPGVKFPDLRRNAAAAIEACDRAIAASPGELRFAYQRARALQAANDPRALSAFQTLMNADYPAAFDNGGQLMANQGRWQEAETLYRRGVQLGDADAMVALADFIKAGKIAPRVASEDIVLYDRAASLGHKGAQQDVEQRRIASEIIRRIPPLFQPPR